MNILSIGGSDPSSGAGIQNDIRVAQLLDSHCFTVITAVTSQNTTEYSATSPVSSKTVLNQIESVMSDFRIDVIKIGMVYDSKTIDVLYGALRSARVPIVVDPVIKSTTGGSLLKRDSVKGFQKKIIPLSHVITPNLEESEIISGIKMTKKSDVKRISNKIISMGARNVIITGMDEDGKITDHVRTKSGEQKIVSKKIRAENHGGGCTFSSALAIAIARRDDVFKAAKFASEFTKKSIINARGLGRGVRITDQRLQDEIKNELADGIVKFVEMDGAHKAIPECQTNFVFSRRDPKDADDVAGIVGRIVRAGDGVIVAGELGFGGSKHVAAAVLEVNRRFPKIRSAINIRYDANTLGKLKSRKLRILRYDRGVEPAHLKRKEGSSVAWGVKSAVAKTKSAPDVIFHRGDMGKEPMILIFAETPQKIIGKIKGIF